MQLENHRWDMAGLQEKTVIEGHQTEFSGFPSGDNGMVVLCSSATDRTENSSELGVGCKMEGSLDTLKKEECPSASELIHWSWS